MIKSKFILDLLDLLLDGDEDEKSVRPQMNYLTEVNYRYTASGLFLTFSHDQEALKYPLAKKGIFLDGVIIKAPELEIGAEVILFFKDGIINYLEIWSHGGDYPNKELLNYTLTQKWRGSSNREITRKNEH